MISIQVHDQETISALDGGGTVRVALDVDHRDLELLRAVADAWNRRELITVTDRVTGEMLGHVRHHAEDAARLRLQGELARLGMTALLVEGPRWVGPDDVEDPAWCEALSGGRLHLLTLRAVVMPMAVLGPAALDLIRPVGEPLAVGDYPRGWTR